MLTRASLARSLSCIAVALAVWSVTAPAPAQPGRFEFKQIDTRLRDYGFVDRAAIWDTDVVVVCWENMDATNAEGRAWVEVAIQETWEKAARVQFTGWKQCTGNSRGVRILIVDEALAPNSYIGKTIRDKLPGMKLNFTFGQWGSDYCKPRVKECIQSIAVHEFGHALGFAHEAIRDDAPQDCKEQVARYAEDKPDQGEELTPYDPQSVMNYCNKVYNNSGRLSELDRVAVQKLYP